MAILRVIPMRKRYDIKRGMEPILIICADFWVLTMCCVLCKELKMNYLHLISQTLTYKMLIYVLMMLVGFKKNTVWLWRLTELRIRSTQFKLQKFLYTFIVDVIHRWTVCACMCVCTGRRVCVGVCVFINFGKDSVVKISWKWCRISSSLLPWPFPPPLSSCLISSFNPFFPPPSSWSLYKNGGAKFFSTKWGLPTQWFSKWP